MIRILMVIAAALVGCSAPKPGVDDLAPRRWVLAQQTLRDLGSGDAIVVRHPVLVLSQQEPEPAARPNRVAVVTHDEDAVVGEPFWLEVTVPRASPSEVHRVRIHPDRPGLRLPDGDVLTTKGSGRVRCRAVADSSGSVRFTAEILQ